MKRIIAVLLMLLLLAACQPTPDHDFVINKGDDIVEQKLSATPVPAQPVEDAVGVDNKTEAPTGETEEPKTADFSVLGNVENVAEHTVLKKITLAAGQAVLLRVIE